jgi:DNA-binding CsgD family transcriptional regulator
MQDNNSLQEKDEQPIFSFIQEIKDGTLAPEALTKDLRQRCVEVFLGEGYSVTSIAQILKRSEKTIKRDIEDIRERNAITPDINLAKKIIGELMMYARINRDYLMKLARTKDASVAEKAQSEYCAFKVLVELMTKLQSLGYLPSKPQAIVGDIFHHVDSGQDVSFIELKTMVDDIINTAKETDTFTLELQKEAENLCKKIEKAEIVTQISALKEKRTKEEDQNEMESIK